MKIAVFGTSGQLGHVLERVLSTRHEVTPYPRDFDVRNREGVFEAVRAARPDVVVNAAAMTNVERCERDDEAFSMNALGARWVAQASAAGGALLVQMSTDYVFRGDKGAPYHEWDDVGPIQDYGRSRLAGEEEAREHAPRHLIVRTAWLYGGKTAGYVQSVLEKARRKETVWAVDDLIGSPTLIDDLAAAVLQLIEAEAMGTVHVANPGSASRYGFAQEVLRCAGATASVRAVASGTLASVVPRPHDCSLTSLVLPAFGVSMRPWTEALRAYVRQESMSQPQ